MKELKDGVEVTDNNTVKASKKRQLLSWYIDFLFFMTVWGLLAYFFRLEERVPFWTPYLVFLVVRGATSKFVGSIGLNFMSIDKNSMHVDSDIVKRENWLSIFLGVLLILEGTKELVRWTQIFVSQPAFGFFPDETSQIVMHIVFGVLAILAGYWFLKLNIKGLVLGVGLFLVNLASYLLSWNLWDPVVEQMVLKKKAVQGVPVREGEIAMMQAIMPEGMVMFGIVVIVAMLFTYRRFKSVAQPA